MEHCLEGALSIEVYGHRSAGFATTTKWDERRQLAKSLADRLDCFISHSIEKNHPEVITLTGNSTKTCIISSSL